MKAIRTVKLKIVGADFKDVSTGYLLAMNWLSKIVFESKDLNSNRIAKAHYATLREKFKLGSQLACSACKQIAATYKTALSLKRWKLAVFKKHVVPIIHNRDFRRTKKGPSIWGTLVQLKGNVPDGAWKDSKIKLVNGVWYLFLAHEIDVPEIKTEGCIVGADLGVKRMFVATNSENSKTIFYRGGILNHHRTCIRFTRAKVQAVGSRSAHRLLWRLRSHEAAVTEHLLHVASKALISYAVENGARKIVLENLTNIRDSSVNKGKNFRAKINRWPFASFQFKVAYKARAFGIETEYVSPKDTSRACPRCGHVAKENRVGLRFACKACGHKADADRNASENIRIRSVSREHNSRETGNCKLPRKLGTVDIVKCALHTATV